MISYIVSAKQQIHGTSWRCFQLQFVFLSNGTDAQESHNIPELVFCASAAQLIKQQEIPGLSSMFICIAICYSPKNVH